MEYAELRCPRCGKVVATYDPEWASNNPNAFDMWAEEELNRHYKFDCPEYSPEEDAIKVYTPCGKYITTIYPDPGYSDRNPNGLSMWIESIQRSYCESCRECWETGEDEEEEESEEDWTEEEVLEDMIKEIKFELENFPNDIRNIVFDKKNKLLRYERLVYMGMHDDPNAWEDKYHVFNELGVEYILERLKENKIPFELRE
jgi:hypothetical protein